MSKNSLAAVSVIIIYTVLSVIGLALLKQAPEIRSLKFLTGAIFYGSGFLIWILFILRLTPLSIGFPIAAGALILGTQVVGYLMFRESITFIHGLGIMFIIIGITLVSWEVV
jgi:multidrug transporter EmrE-like cation transporter